MNALVTVDIATLTPATVFAPGGVEAIISKIETEVSAEVFTLDTAEGRERIKSVAYKVARSKTALDDMGKELVAGIKAQAGAIDADRRTIRDRLDALKERVRGPLTAWEQAEQERVKDHEAALCVIMEPISPFATPNAIREIIERNAVLSARDWQEFKERADVAIAAAMHLLNDRLQTAEQAERDAAELAELRRLKAERDEADRKAEAERIAAQQAAERKAYEERREKERAEQQAERERQQAARAEQQKAEAVAAAIEQERRRQEAEAYRATQQKAAEDAAKAKREANGRHRAKVHKEIMDALCTAGLSGPEANDFVGMIIDGKIPHVSITY